MRLFEPFELKKLNLKNRIVMPPMCQYSVWEKDGIINDWHHQHYVSRAVGGVGAIIIEMTDVDPDGRITDYDLGLWDDDQVAPLRELVASIKAQGAKVGIQIAHAGRKAQDAAEPVAPSALDIDLTGRIPRALATEEVEIIIEQFSAAARRAVAAGVDFIELHGAHGYLIQQFHSPLTNQREDKYGQDLALFGESVIKAVKQVIPTDMVLGFRISAVEYTPGGYDLSHALQLLYRYKAAGIDLVHVSTGGESQTGPDKVYAGYQVDYAQAIKQAVDLPVIAVGLLQDVKLANQILEESDVDLVAVGRGMLKDPYWALHGAETLGTQIEIPQQYQRGFRIR